MLDNLSVRYTAKPGKRLALLVLTALLSTVGTSCSRHRPTGPALHDTAPVLHKTPRPNESPKTVRRVGLPLAANRR